MRYVGDIVAEFRHEVLSNTVSQFIPPQSLPEQWDVAGLEEELKREFAAELSVQQWLDNEQNLYEETLRERIEEQIVAQYQAKEELVGAENLRMFEKHIILRVLDDLWKDHLAAMDHLRQGIHLRGYAQKNPKQEYKRESFNLFRDLLDAVKHDSIRYLSFVQVRQEDTEEEEARLRQQAQERASRMQYTHGAAEEEQAQGDAPSSNEPVRNLTKVGRNEPCTCGSGKKYKHCCGKIA